MHGGTCRNKFGQSINLKNWAESEISIVKLQVSYFWILESADYFLSEERQVVCPLPLGIQPYVYISSLWLRLNEAINYAFVSVSVGLEKNLMHITYSPNPMPRKYEIVFVRCHCIKPTLFRLIMKTFLLIEQHWY